MRKDELRDLIREAILISCLQERSRGWETHAIPQYNMNGNTRASCTSATPPRNSEWSQNTRMAECVRNGK